MTQEDRDLLIRIDENVKGLKEDSSEVFGRLSPLEMRVSSLETSHKDCVERQKEPKQWPSIVSAICAVGAVIWAVFTKK